MTQSTQLPLQMRRTGFDPLPEVGQSRQEQGVAAHIAFGHGIHHCLGAPPTRMEMRIAFPRSCSAFPASRRPIRRSRATCGPSTPSTG